MRVTSVSGYRADPCGKALTQAAQGRRGRGHQITGQVEQQARERLHVTWKGCGAGDGEQPVAPACRAKEPSRRGSADASFARDEQHPARARRGVGEPASSIRVRKASRPTSTGDWTTPRTGTRATSPRSKYPLPGD